MAWKDYNFHFLNTVSQQLVDELEQLAITVLNTDSLADLDAFQVRIKSSQGVYLLHLNGNPVYLGKAGNVRERLMQHLAKLTGRMEGGQPLNLGNIGFKALLLDQSMSTAANEDVLIAFFQKDHKGLWNNKGFGPKDPGKQRDTTKPSYFDKTYPINKAFPVGGVDDRTTIGELFRVMKQALPFVFRYQALPKPIADTQIDLTDVTREAGTLLKAAIASFPPGWHAAMVSFGMVIYKGSKAYWHTAEVIVSPGSPPPLPPLTEEETDD
ncbi:hypothetical protein [Stenotrophomonas maltophilia]|jgi:hypothetical protein|uniref:hypothetical protein n=1 Tax=Stenotrophomonas maltophilia TaxID=40324 RepID=UPI001FA817DF|nr:hypothetical protein [Stenotrophomonas maltophilia]